MPAKLSTRVACAAAPLDALNSILSAHGIPLPGDKQVAADAVAALIDASKASFADLRKPAAAQPAAKTAARAAKPAARAAKPAAMPVPDTVAQEVAAAAAASITRRMDDTDLEINAVRTIVGEISQDFAKRLDEVTAIQRGRTEALQTAIEATGAQVATLSRALAQRPDPAEALRSIAGEQVMAAVREAFAPFRALVESQGQQEAVATLAAAPEQRELWPGHTGAFWGHPEAPRVDPGYVWPDPLIRSLMSAQKRSRNVWLAGPKGSGKSTAAEQFAARSGRAFYRIQFNRHTTAEDFVGGMGLVEGATQFVPGTLLTALTTPGAVVLLDEISTADPGVLAILHGLLEPASTIHIGGRAWTRAPGVMILAADNTAGSGDSTGRYAGTREQNSALVDRFATMILIDAMTVDQMTAVLAGRTGCSERLARHIAEAFRACAAEVTAGNVIDAPSLRRAVALIECLMDGIPPSEAWQQAVQLHQPAEGAAGLYAVFCAHIDSTLIGQEI